MPIRTHRGRAAVYRKLWAWPLRSPRHLVMAAFVLALLAIGIGYVAPKATSPLAGRPAVTTTNGVAASQPGAAAPAAPGANAPGAATTTSRVPRVTLTPPAPAPPAPEALAVAEAWARAWVNHPDGMTNDEWTAQLAPLTTEEFLPQLRSVDPANIPSTSVTGRAEPITASARAVDVKIDTDGAELRLTVIATDAGWRVSALTRAE